MKEKIRKVFIKHISQVETLQCEKCGGEMKKSRKTTGEAGCLLILAGLLLLIIFFPIGIVLLVIGVIYGSKQQGFWVCKNCGYQFERKIGFWG